MNPFKALLFQLRGSGKNEPRFDHLNIDEVFQRALHYSLFSEHDKAALALQNCIQRESHRPEFYLQLARTYLSLKKRDLSIQILKDLLLRPELQDELRAGIGRFLLSLLSPIKEPRELLKVYERLRGSEVSNEETLSKVLEAYLELRQWDSAEAIAKALRAQGASTDTYLARISLGRLRTEFPTGVGALAGAHKLVKKYPQYSPAWEFELELVRQKHVPKELLALWNAFIYAAPAEACSRLSQLESDLFEGDLFGELLPLYRQMNANLQELPLSFFVHYARALIREGHWNEASHLALDMFVKEEAQVALDFLVQEILPKQPSESDFPKKLCRMLASLPNAKGPQ